MRSAACALVAALLLGATALAAAQPLVPGPHTALGTAGFHADAIGTLWNLFLGVCTFVFVAIFVTFVWAVRRAGRSVATTPPDMASVGRHEPGPYRSVLIALGVSTVLLLVLLVASLAADRAIGRLALDGAVQIKVVGHQWWWEAEYSGEVASDTFTTANELHVPVGRPVIMTLGSEDVIHSLWVPSLAGKMDLIPGRTSVMRLRADRPGRYRGQCAEFCGVQHAFMAFEVIADPPEQFAAWQAAQRREAAQPADALARHGREVFMRGQCVLCHTIQGTDARARTGPDLTHIGGRATLAAGRLPNTSAALEGWIRDPQQAKPGSNMPASTLADADLRALVAYLGSLK